MSFSKAIDVFLLPGECFVGDERYRIRTLVGSCVSMTLWHPRVRIGAMCHFLLPGVSRRPGSAASGTYGIDAMDMMVAELQRLGVNLGQCQGKIFGGGAMFPRHDKQVDIGRQNGDCARLLMQKYGVHVVSEDLFGDGHRQLIFTLKSGEVLCRQVPLDAAAPVRRVKENA
ncbi:chemotaxis protein CheD [Rugamonas sp.]|uniref:chemotaxis protein CheD n=1 Tax=Rugamonas sp. TaxID=1926287 RepID=UPI0025E6B005|nr:chemotaxis protein CheD [Rugamonas sp.]